MLSRAFTVTQTRAKTAAAELEGLRETLSSLPDEAIEGVEMEVLATERDYEKALEYLKREEEAIKEENEAQAHGEETDVAEAAEAQGPKPGPSTAEVTAAAVSAAVFKEARAAAMAESLEGESAEEKAARAAAARENKMRKVISALSALASTSGVSSEREQFMSLVANEVQRLNKDLSARSAVSMTFTGGKAQVARPESGQAPIGATRLEDRITRILKRIERELDDADSKIGERMHVLDMDNDGLISQAELRSALGFLQEQLGEDELRQLLEKLQVKAAARTGEAGAIDVKGLMALAEEASGSQVTR